MKIYIDGIELNSKKVGYRSFGFGFGKLEHYKKLSSYQLKIPRDEFNINFNKYYQKLVKELKEDDQIMGVDFDPPFNGAINYPTLEELDALDSKQLTEWLDYLNVKIYEYCFPWNYDESHKVDYVIITLDQIDLIDEEFVFSGQADHNYLWCPVRTTDTSVL